ncbi:hypothetical protein GCM10009837_36810 [Streptomyces durmitorensis]
MLGRGRGLDVESGERGTRQVPMTADRDLAGGRVELGEQRAVLVVGVGGLRDGEHGGVLELAGPGVGDRALIRGGRGEPGLHEVVAVAEVGQEQGRVDGRDHAAQPQPLVRVRRDHLGHRLGLDGVPQLDDREPCEAGVREPFELGHQILAQGAARTVVDQRRLTGGEHSGGVAHRTYDRAVHGRRQVVVERHAPRDSGEEPLDGLLAGVGVQSADDGDVHGQGAGVRAGVGVGARAGTRAGVAVHRARRAL